MAESAHRVVVVGGGFGGLQAVQKLQHLPVEVMLIDRRNFHLFQPLSYQVATGALSPGQIAYPLRTIFRRARNVRVLLGDVHDVDLAAREVRLHAVAGIPVPPSVPYDTLVVAGGSKYSYFGHDDWQQYAAEVKSLESALTVRSRILAAFEAAESTSDPDERAAWLTFVVVGGGPTGVEMAGQIAELARDTLRDDFRSSDPRGARILIVESTDRLLGTFPASLSDRAARSLRRLGATPMLGSTVVGIDEHGVTVSSAGGEQERIPSRTVVWAAGVAGAAVAGRLSALTGAELDRAGRVLVGPDLTLPDHPEVFALGDMVRVRGADGRVMELPGVAPVAMQQGRYVARVIGDRLQGKQPPAFHYRDKGNLATIGRGSAVADIKGLKLSGVIAWVTWLTVHLWYLVGFENRVLVFTQWFFSFITRGRAARLITGGGHDAYTPPAADG